MIKVIFPIAIPKAESQQGHYHLRMTALEESRAIAFSWELKRKVVSVKSRWRQADKAELPGCMATFSNNDIYFSHKATMELTNYKYNFQAF